MCENMEVKIEKFRMKLSRTTGRLYSYWYPLHEIHPRIPAVAFWEYQLPNQKHFAEEIKTVLQQLHIKEAVAVCTDSCKVSHIENLAEWLFCEEENGEIDFWCSETYFFDKSHHWLLYISHESTISFAGRRLVEAVKRTVSASFTAENGLSFTNLKMSRQE